LRPRVGKLVRGLAVGDGIGSSADDGYIDVCSIERELAEIGHGENAEAAAEDGFVVAERAIGKTEARLKIFSVELTYTWTEADFIGELDPSAGHAGS